MNVIYVYTVGESGHITDVEVYEDAPDLSYVADTIKVLAMIKDRFGGEDVDGRIVEHSHDDLLGWPTHKITWYAREGSDIKLFGLGVAVG